MKLDLELKAGQVCKTIGYYSINDGGGAFTADCIGVMLYHIEF